MKQFTLAMIGCGGNSPMHFDAYLPHPDRIKLVAVCDADPQRMNEKRQRYNVPQGFTSLEEMIAQSEWEVAVVCTPTNVRRQIVDTLAAAGKQVFVEKPFADNYQEAQHMVNTCAQAGVGLAVNQNFRYHYPFDVARSLVAQGEIGHVVNIVHQDLHFRRDVGWRTQQKRHAMAVMGVHWFDGFRRILNDEATSIFCQTRSSAAIQSAGESESSALVNFKQGAFVTYVQSFSAPGPLTETQIIGETGELVLTYDGVSLFDQDHRNTPRRQWENPYRGANKPEATFIALNHFLTALEQGSEPENSGRDNLKTIALLDAAYRSAEEGRPIYFHEGEIA